MPDVADRADADARGHPDRIAERVVLEHVAIEIGEHQRVAAIQSHRAGGHRQPAYRHARLKTGESLSDIMLKDRLAAFAVGDGVDPRLNLTFDNVCDVPRQRALISCQVDGMPGRELVQHLQHVRRPRQAAGMSRADPVDAASHAHRPATPPWPRPL